MVIVIRAAFDDASAGVCEPFWASANFTSPARPLGLIIIAHCASAAQTKRLRRQMVEYLTRQRLACCTVPLTGEDEHLAGRMIIDVETLSDRLEGVVKFMRQLDETTDLPTAVFGEHDCGAAALLAAARLGKSVQAAGAYCGRPDLVRFELPQIEAPTLLVVPGRDPDLLAQNELGFQLLECPSQIAVIRNATRRLNEVGAAGACCRLIRRWCECHVVKRSRYQHAD
jgi:putative phosphoribosyl transferase